MSEIINTTIQCPFCKCDGFVNDKLRDEGIKPAEYVRDAVLQLYGKSETK